ncbi:autotransporter domain-containing protein [Paenalcaligenes sp. Me52]|uniref:autotransporter domain-containing protein n=1 Tax=Paenalcaligenes sp. Me52 TaxID=3392038 RepID=UPI003D2751E5
MSGFISGQSDDVSDGGAALRISNGAGGTTSVINSGFIQAGRVVASSGELEDLIAMTLRGGAKQVVRNSGTITGRVGMQASTAGNEFINIGTVQGSVHLGAGGGRNRFIAVTGSSLVSNARVGKSITVANVNYAATGTVYAGSANNGNILALQNSINGVGAGTAGSGTIDGDKYLNFSHLVVNSGTWNLSGNLFPSSTPNPTVALNGGVLNVAGVAHAGVTVAAGAALKGTGTVGAVTVRKDGRVVGRSGSTLTMDSLTLGTDSQVDVVLGAPGLGTPEIFKVNQNLTLDGVLNVTDAGDFGSGVYRLFTYGGSLTYNGLSLGTLPNGWQAGDLTIQIAIANQVNVVVKASGQEVQFWDGSDNVANGQIEGGSGVWNSTNTNWTTWDGNANDRWSAGVAVFQGRAGTVTVEGRQTVSGMQFITDGYTLAKGAAGELSLVSGQAGGANIRVGADITAVIEAPMTGSSSVEKLEAGTLILSGNNSYSGGTALRGGSLLVGHSNALGQGTLTTYNGTTLGATGNQTVHNQVDLNGALTITGNDSLTLGGRIAGTGSLVKQGTGTLTLNGNNTYSNGTTLNEGTLVVGSNTVLGEGTLTAAAGTVLDSSNTVALSNAVLVTGNLTVAGSNELILSGVIRGAGALVKNGAAQLTLNGSNTHAGGLLLNAGSLEVGNNKALGSGELVVASNTSLDSSVDVVLSNKVVLQGELKVLGSKALTVEGDIRGNGSLSKLGTATLTLAGHNTYTGDTSVKAGRLQLQANSSLASAQVMVESGATLAGQGVLAGNVQVESGAVLAPGEAIGTGNLTIQGDLAMEQGSSLTVALGAPGPNMSTPGQGTSTSVDGDLTLNGVQLDVQQVSGFGDGLYRLFDYKGALTLLNGGLMPSSAGMTVQYLAGSKQINVINGSGGLTLNFWNANGLASSSRLGGGSGVWSTASAYWADFQGTLTSAMNPQPGFAIFGGDAGIVSVSNQDGAVQASGMQFASDGYVMDGDTLTLVVGSTNSDPVEIRVGDGSAVSHRWHASIKNVLAGSDGLNKTGAGTLLLTAVNSYSGGTTVSAGTLSVEQDASLGQSGEAVTLNGGRLQITGTSFTSNGNRAWSVGAQGGTVDIADSANLFTLDSDLSGSGVFTKAGDGTLVLTGANSYSGGTVIDGGKLVASVANLGSGTIKTNAELQLDQGSNATLSQAIEGSGSVTKTGTGELHLTGHNTWSGGLHIDDGSVVASADSLGSGAIVNNANLQLQQSNDATLAQAISGTGYISKTGAGVLTLTGNSSTFSGSTQVTDGGLLITKNSSLGGDVTVANGATLAGTGTVGSAATLTTVQRGATINPSENATRYGTMRIAGDLRLEQGSTYYVQADPDSDNSSLLKVAGTATLGGSVLHAGTELNAKTDFQVGKTYTILEASSIQGNFGEVKSNYAYLDVALGYGANAVSLKLERKSEEEEGGGTTIIDFADLAQTGNQVATAQGIESLPSSHALYKFVETLPAGAPPAVFDSLSGEAHASVASGLASVGSLASNLGSQHLYSNLTAGRRAGDPVAQSDGALPASAWPSSKALPAWAEVIGHWQRFDGNNNVGQMKQRTTGVFLGMDEKVGGSEWRVGAAVGYIHAKTDVDDRSSNTKVDNYSVAIYAGRSMEAGANHINMLGGLAYTWHDIRTERTVSSLDQKLKADYSAHTAQAFAEVGYAFGQYEQMGIEPFVGMSVSEQRIRGFSEKGGFAALEGKSSNHTLASSTLGVRLHNNFQMGEYDGRLRATLGWRHAIGSVTSDRTMAFEGGQNFTVAGVPLARDTALIELGAEVLLSRYSSVGIGYKGELGNGQRDHSAQVQVRVAF